MSEEAAMRISFVAGITLIAGSAAALLYAQHKPDFLGDGRVASSIGSATVAQPLLQGLPPVSGEWSRTDYVGAEAARDAFVRFGRAPESALAGRTPVESAAAFYTDGRDRFIILAERFQTVAGQGWTPPKGSTVIVDGRIFQGHLDPQSGAIDLRLETPDGVLIAIRGHADYHTLEAFLKRMAIRKTISA